MAPVVQEQVLPTAPELPPTAHPEEEQYSAVPCLAAPPQVGGGRLDFLQVGGFRISFSFFFSRFVFAEDGCHHLGPEISTIPQKIAVLFIHREILFLHVKARQPFLFFFPRKR